MNRAAYMREYRKTDHYKKVELPKHRVRNRINAKRYLTNANNKLKEKVRLETINWLFNYWKELKQEGMTEKQFIIKFDKYLKSVLGKVDIHTCDFIAIPSNSLGVELMCRICGKEKIL